MFRLFEGVEDFCWCLKFFTSQVLELFVDPFFGLELGVLGRFLGVQ